MLDEVMLSTCLILLSAFLWSCYIILLNGHFQADFNTLSMVVLQLKSIRGLIVAGALDYEDFQQHLRSLEPALQLSVKDLRSQIVREAGLSIS